MELTQGEQTIVESHSLIITKRADAVRQAIQNYNDSILDLYDEIGEALQDYNEAALDAREAIDGIVRSLLERWERRDDGWRLSRVGYTIRQWIGHWEDVSELIDDRLALDPRTMPVPLDVPIGIMDGRGWRVAAPGFTSGDPWLRLVR